MQENEVAKTEASAAAQLSIGSLSRATGCAIETIRYYERIGLIPEPARTPGNHRLYDDSHTVRLTFIRHCRDLDLPLHQVRELLKLVHDDLDPAEIRAVALIQADQIQAKLKKYRKRLRSLKKMAAGCSGDTAPRCAAIDTLSELEADL